MCKFAACGKLGKQAIACDMNLMGFVPPSDYDKSIINMK